MMPSSAGDTSLASVAARFVLCAMAGLAATTGSMATAQQKEEDVEKAEVREGRLYNLTARPFTLQLHRADGIAWTEGYVVQPGKFLAIHAPKAGETSEIQGLTGNGRGYVIIRHYEPVLGGYMTAAPARPKPGESAVATDLVRRPGRQRHHADDPRARRRAGAGRAGSAQEANPHDARRIGTQQAHAARQLGADRLTPPWPEIPVTRVPRQLARTKTGILPASRLPPRIRPSRC